MDCKANLEMLSRFLGYGNADTAQIVFVGYESGGATEEEITKRDYPDRVAQRTRLCQHHLVESGRPYICLPRNKWAELKGIPANDLLEDLASSPFRVTERIQVHFSMAYRKNCLTEDVSSYNSPKEYNTKEFCSTHELQINLFPIQSPRKDREYPKRMLETFGLSLLPKREIEELLWTKGQRLMLLEELFSQIARTAGKHVVLFMGCERKREEICSRIFSKHSFKDIRRREFKGRTYKRERTLYHSEDRTVWFTQHPSGGLLSSAVADFIIDEICSFHKGG